MEHKGIKHVSVIIGGPPCQAYSLVGRAQTNHMLRPMEEDPRNELYKQYVNFLKRYEPEMFVFENVQGLTSAAVRKIFKKLEAEGLIVGTGENKNRTYLLCLRNSRKS